MLVDLCNGHRTVVVVVEIGGYRTVRSSLLPPSLLLSMLIIPVIMWTLRTAQFDYATSLPVLHDTSSCC